MNTKLPEGWHWTDWREQRGELFQAVGDEKEHDGLNVWTDCRYCGFNIISAPDYGGDGETGRSCDFENTGHDRPTSCWRFSWFKEPTVV